MKIYLGADHRGFALKNKVMEWLQEWGKEYEDKGAFKLDPKDDYTTFASRVGSLVGKDKNAQGILICASGVGEDVAANKFDGVRASIGKTPEQVQAGRNDDDMNILVIAAEYTKEGEAKEMVKAFLETEFAAKPRFKRRLQDIKDIEANN